MAEPQHVEAEGAGSATSASDSSVAAPESAAVVPDSAAVTASRGVRNSLVLLLGELMAATGLFVMLFVAWLVWGGTSQPDAHVRAVNQAVVKAWAGAAVQRAAPAAGTQIALIRIPALGAGWEYPVYEGISEDTLDKGIAHYSQTASPGMVGNYAIAGHRSSDIGFHPWADLPDDVVRGSTVIILTPQTVYTYVIDASEQTTPTNLAPLQPDQGRGADPKTRLITLTTCTPRFGSTGRFILYGHLAAQRPFTKGDS